MSKILIIEKDINISHSLQTQFLIVGMDVFIIDGVEKDVETLFAKILKYSPDYIIIDLYLQMFDSFLVIDKIKQSKLTSKIFVYDKLDGEMQKKCIQHRVDYFFSSDGFSLNQFAVKALTVINNQEKIK